MADTTTNRLARLPTDECLVNFDRASASAEMHGAVVRHSFADTVRHEPRGLERDAKDAMQLIAADAFLTAAHQVDGLQPEVQGDVAVLKDRAHADGELRAAITALLEAMAFDALRVLDRSLRTNAIQDIRCGEAAALRANRALRPEHRLNMRERSGFIVHVGGGQDGHGGFLDLYAKGKPFTVVCQV